jgi:hypothetical protein
MLQAKARNAHHGLKNRGLRGLKPFSVKYHKDQKVDENDSEEQSLDRA